MTDQEPVNPYAASISVPESDAFAKPGPMIAERWLRLVAAMVDTFIIMVIVVPIQIASGYMDRIFNDEVTMIDEFTMTLVGLFAFLLPNIYLLLHRGQTVGKWLIGIKIVDQATAEVPPFIRIYLFRYLWTLPLILLVILIPGTVDNLLVNFVILADVLLIFGPARRCLHDRIAGTVVIHA